jgi:hypothetical protein
LSQKVAVLVYVHLSAALLQYQVPIRTSKPPQIWHGGSSNKHGRSYKEDGGVNIFVLKEAVRLKRGGAYAVNALLIALITAV